MLHQLHNALIYKEYCFQTGFVHVLQNERAQLNKYQSFASTESPYEWTLQRLFVRPSMYMHAVLD